MQQSYFCRCGEVLLYWTPQAVWVPKWSILPGIQFPHRLDFHSRTSKYMCFKIQLSKYLKETKLSLRKTSASFFPVNLLGYFTPCMQLSWMYCLCLPHSSYKCKKVHFLRFFKQIWKWTSNQRKINANVGQP